MGLFVYTYKIDTPGSSVIESVAYSNVGQALAVKFHSGKVRVYTEVPQRVFNWMEEDYSNGSSIGKTYNTYIKGAFSSYEADFDCDFRPEPTESTEPETGTSISVNLNTSVKESYTVTGLVGDQEVEFSAEALSEAEAIEEAVDVADRLGLVLDVKAVTHHLA